MSYFSFQGMDIYYEEYGTGRPILMLNGIMMSCISWAEFIEPLSANNHLILMDMLDQGRSSKMDSPFTQAIQVAVVHALLDHLKLDKVNIMGISYGSEVGLQFTLNYPSRVDRLLVFNAAAATGPWLKDIGDAWNKASADGEGYYLTTIPVIYSPAFYKREKEWMDRRRELLVPIFGNPAFVESMVRLTNSAKDYDVRDLIHKITAPTLVVSCEQDYLTPIEEQRFIAAQIPHCDHVVIPNCGHASMYEKPVLFTSLVLGFVNNTKTSYQIG